jgi:hypothetical protein
MIFGASPFPFTHPVQATAGFVPRSFDTRFVSEFEPGPGMFPDALRLPAGVTQPLASEPGHTVSALQGALGKAKGVPSSPLTRGKMLTRALPARVRKAVTDEQLRKRLNPDQLVTRGRNPGA